MEEKLKIIKEQIKESCPSFDDEEPSQHGVSVYDLDPFDCPIKNNKLTISEINSGFIQYLYMLVENPYFKVGYMISPEFSTFQAEVKRSLEEAFAEEKHIEDLQNSSEKQE